MHAFIVHRQVTYWITYNADEVRDHVTTSDLRKLLTTVSRKRPMTKQETGTGGGGGLRMESLPYKDAMGHNKYD